MEPNRQNELYYEINQVFSPGAPVDRYALFAGRTDIARKVIDAIYQRGQHVVIFGERGVGKTSLVSVLAEILSQTGHRRLQSGTVNCDARDTYEKLWSKIFRELTVTTRSKGVGFNAKETVQTIRLDNIPTENLCPEDVRYWLQQIGGQAIIILDELDQVEDQSVTALLADTIKTLSDHSVDTTLVAVGVADSVDQLIHHHSSIERALVQIRMPRMSPEELEEIIDKSLQKLGMTIDEECKGHLTILSQGLPHFTHLLGLHAARNAVARGTTHIVSEDLNGAICEAVNRGHQSIMSAYHRATSSPQKENLYKKVLLACALARTDDLGFFAPADVREPMSLIMGKRYEIPTFARHLNDLCDLSRGCVLEKTGPSRKHRFRFVNPLMQPFVTIHGIAKGLIDRETLLAASTSTRAEVLVA